MKRNAGMKIFLALGIIGVAAMMVYNLQLGDSMVLFLTPAEAATRAGELQTQKIRVGAMVVANTVKWDASSLDLNFVLSDMKGNDINVHHKGQPPDMFKEGSGVVVEGRLGADGKSFESTKLLVKHSEEYKKPGDHALLDPDAIKSEILKNESLKE